MKVWLNRNRCAGHAHCHAIDAARFPIDDSGYSSLEPFEVAAADDNIVRRGVGSCPERALYMRESEPLKLSLQLLYILRSAPQVWGSGRY